MQYPVQSLSPDVISSLLETFKMAMAKVIDITQKGRAPDQSLRFVKVFNGVRDPVAYSEATVNNWKLAPNSYKYLQHIYAFKTKGRYSKQMDDNMFFSVIMDVIAKAFAKGDVIRTFGYFCGNVAKCNLAPLYHAFERVSKNTRKKIEDIFNNAKIFMSTLKKKAKQRIFKDQALDKDKSKDQEPTMLRDVNKKEVLGYERPNDDNEHTDKAYKMLLDEKERFEESMKICEMIYEVVKDVPELDPKNFQEEPSGDDVRFEPIVYSEYYKISLKELIPNRADRRALIKEYGSEERVVKAIENGECPHDSLLPSSNGFR